MTIVEKYVAKINNYISTEKIEKHALPPLREK
jgi:hypothetical protein